MPHNGTLPTTDEKIWRLAKTSKDLSVMVNGVEVLRYYFSDSPFSSCQNWMDERSNSYVHFWNRTVDEGAKEYRCEYHVECICSFINKSVSAVVGCSQPEDEVATVEALYQIGTVLQPEQEPECVRGSLVRGAITCLESRTWSELGCTPPGRIHFPVCSHTIHEQNALPIFPKKSCW